MGRVVVIGVASAAVLVALPRDVQFGLLAAIWALCAIGNAVAAIAMLRRRPTLFVPIVGGASGLAAVHLSPWPELASWAALPPLLDLGTSLVGAGLVVALVRFPLRRPRPISRPLPPMRLLLVENHPVFAETVTTTFLAAHHVVIVPSIREAMIALSRGRFDVALVDYDLDDGKGDELVRWVRASAKHVRLVAISAHDEGNSALLIAGADAACRKAEFSRIEQVLQCVRPDGGQRGFHWRLARSDRLRGRPPSARLTDRLVAAVLMFMAEHEVSALVVREVGEASAALGLAPGATLDADGVCDAIRASLHDGLWCRLEAGDLAVHVGRYYLHVESGRDCPRALELATHDFELAVEAVARSGR